MLARSAETLVCEAARDFDAFYAARAAPPAAETGPILVAAVDCKGIPVVKPEKALRVVRRGKGEKANKKRMATVAAVFTQEPRPRTPEEVVANLLDPPRPRLVGAESESRPRVPRPEHKRGLTRGYSTVTDFARFRGLSISRPFADAT